LPFFLPRKKSGKILKRTAKEEWELTTWSPFSHGGIPQKILSLLRCLAPRGLACFPGAPNLVSRGCAEDYELYREPEDQAMGLCATCQPFHMDLSKSGLDIRVCVWTYTPYT
jgi:hypothetical protein